MMLLLTCRGDINCSILDSGVPGGHSASPIIGLKKNGLLLWNYTLHLKGGFPDLFGADQGGHDAHVGREEELQTHDEDRQDGKRHQLETVVHQLQRGEIHREIKNTRVGKHNKQVERSGADI